MPALARLTGPLRRLARTIAALLLASMFVTFLLQILFRYVFNDPLGWSVEWVAIAWLWGILFGYAFVVEDRDIVRLDLVYAMAGRGVQRAMRVAGGLVVAGLMLWTLPAVWGYVRFMEVERTAVLRLPFDLVFAVYLPFAVSVAVRALLDAWHGLAGTGRHAVPSHAGPAGHG